MSAELNRKVDQGSPRDTLQALQAPRRRTQGSAHGMRWRLPDRTRPGTDGPRRHRPAVTACGSGTACQGQL
ncbi:unnamed protein product [Boreogadus saida]